MMKGGIDKHKMQQTKRTHINFLIPFPDIDKINIYKYYYVTHIHKL